MKVQQGSTSISRYVFHNNKIYIWNVHHLTEYQNKVFWK